MRDLDRLRWRLAEAIAWCVPHIAVTAPAGCLRSAELRPLMRPENVFESDHYDQATWSTYVHSQSIHNTAAEVERLAEERARLLGQRGHYPARMAPHLADGRLLLSAPDYGYYDGASEYDSDGYIDVGDAPPWDTWVGFATGDADLAQRFYEGAIIAWVPPQFVARVDAGIDVSFVNNIVWLSTVECALTQRLRAVGLA